MCDKEEYKMIIKKNILIIGDEEIWRKQPLYPREYCFTVSGMDKSDFGSGKNWWSLDFWKELDEFLGDKKFNIVHIDIGSEIWLMDKNQKYEDFRGKDQSFIEDFVEKMYEILLPNQKERPNTLVMFRRNQNFKEYFINYCNSVFSKMMEVITKHLDNKVGLFLLPVKNEKVYKGIYTTIYYYLTEKEFKCLRDTTTVKIDGIGIDTDVSFIFLSKNDLDFKNITKDFNNKNIDVMMKKFGKSLIPEK
jgi:hypothetical protein